MSGQLRKIIRVVEGTRNGEISDWARRHFASKYGERAAKMAEVCRREGLRDLVIPLAQLSEIIPHLKPKDHCSGGYPRRCTSNPVLVAITDSGAEGFFCELCAERRVVRMPGF